MRLVNLLSLFSLCLVLCLSVLAADFGLADSEAGSSRCLGLKQAAEARTAGSAFPHVTIDTRVEPESGDTREENIRIGLEMNLADLARARSATERAEADCARLVAADTLQQTLESGAIEVDVAGLAARKRALDRALADATETLALRHKRLAAFLDTRAGVSSTGAEIAALKLDLIQTEGRLLEAEKRRANLTRDAKSPRELAADLLQATASAHAAQATDLRGPAWDLTIGAGWERERLIDDDGTRYGTARPVYGTVGIKWRPGRTFSGTDVASTSAGSSAEQSLVREASLFEEKRDLMAKIEAGKISAATERMTQIDADLALIVASRKEGDEYGLRLEREKRALNVDLAESRARLVALGGEPTAATEGAPQPVDDGLKPVATLVATEGETSQASQGFWRTTGEKVRARAENGGGAKRIKAEFHYLGPTAKIVPLASGEERRQFGVWLAAKNQCNLLYVMWRLATKGDGQGEVVVQRKVNPGMQSHEECGNGGYATVEPKKRIIPKTLQPGSKATMHVTLMEARLLVHIDGQLVWENEVNLAGLDPVHGAVGFRSDNARVEFTFLHAAGETK